MGDRFGEMLEQEAQLRVRLNLKLKNGLPEIVDIHFSSFFVAIFIDLYKIDFLNVNSNS